MNTDQKKIPTRADLVDDIDLKHRDNCTEPREVVRMGRFGDPLLSCRDCAVFRVVTPWMLLDAATVMAAPPEPPKPHKEPQKRPAAPPAVVSNWRCRDHPDEIVTWRGTGCRACRQEARR